jgi:hypothetical protein
MSRRELGRVEILAQVKSQQLRLVGAAVLMGVGYRQAKRLGKRYREEGVAVHAVMAIAFKKPFTPETQSLRDGVDVSDKEHEEVPCGMCEAVYVLLYPRSSTPDLKLQYRRAVLRHMGDCNHHPPLIRLEF